MLVTVLHQRSSEENNMACRVVPLNVYLIFERQLCSVVVSLKQVFVKKIYLFMTQGFSHTSCIFKLNCYRRQS